MPGRNQLRCNSPHLNAGSLAAAPWSDGHAARAANCCRLSTAAHTGIPRPLQASCTNTSVTNSGELDRARLMLVLIGARLAGCCLGGAGGVLCLPPEAGWGVGLIMMAAVVDSGAVVDEERVSDEGEGVLVGAVRPNGSST